MAAFDLVYTETIDTLEKEIPAYLTYHTATHTRYVLDKAILLGRSENISEKDLTLVKTAALFHDAGFLKNRNDHESLGCEIVKKQLPKYGYGSNDINMICGMIMATKIPQCPKNLLEKIVADADLEYLGTDLFDLGSQRLYDELLHFDPQLTLRDWYEIQIDFLHEHHYHTDFCIRYREPRKKENLKKVKNKLMLSQ